MKCDRLRLGSWVMKKRDRLDAAASARVRSGVKASAIGNGGHRCCLASMCGRYIVLPVRTLVPTHTHMHTPTHMGYNILFMLTLCKRKRNRKRIPCVSQAKADSEKKSEKERERDRERVREIEGM